MKTGKVYLTGGGCGDAGLLTLKALTVLHSCDVVIYDSLVSEALLHWTKSDCVKIYVGKRYGSHAMRQSEINALLVEQARAGKTVVRLKGGDPYVFGRGGEEFLSLREAGIWCEEIPGISSAIAVPAAAGIPVTHRGVSGGLMIVTGTAAGEGEAGHAGLNLDFELLARLQGTLVILMGMHHLKEITEGLMAAGKDSDTPCAVIMEGTTGRQRCLRTILARLFADAKEQGFTSPAVIVIGAVAELELLSQDNCDVENNRIFEEACESNRICDEECEPEKEKNTEEEREFWHMQLMEGEQKLRRIHVSEECKVENASPFNRSLAGLTVGATGTTHFTEKLSEALAQKGAEVWDMGFMAVRPNENSLPKLDDCVWLVFTSPNGVRVFFDKMKQERKDLRMLHGKRIAVIGQGTAEVLEKAGIYADYMPDVYDAVHLAEGLTDQILAEWVPDDQHLTHRQDAYQDKVPAVFLRAREGSEALPRIFSEKGIPFLEYPIYNLEIQEEKRAAAITRQPDWIVFGSAMGVRAYFEGMKQAGIVNIRSRYLCIGERCGEELKRHTDEKFLTACEPSVKAIAECLCERRERL